MKRSAPPASSLKSHAIGLWLNWKGSFLVMDSPNIKGTELPGTKKRSLNSASPNGIESLSPELSRVDRGRRAEQQAAYWLGAQGFELLAENFRHPFAQIDLLMRRRKTLFIVEVKSGAVEDAAILVKSLGREQTNRLCRAARALWSRRHEYGCESVSGILVLVGKKEIKKLSLQLLSDSS